MCYPHLKHDLRTSCTILNSMISSVADPVSQRHPFGAARAQHSRAVSRVYPGHDEHGVLPWSVRRGRPVYWRQGQWPATALFECVRLASCRLCAAASTRMCWMFGCVRPFPPHDLPSLLCAARARHGRRERGLRHLRPLRCVSTRCPCESQANHVTHFFVSPSLAAQPVRGATGRISVAQGGKGYVQPAHWL